MLITPLVTSSESTNSTSVPTAKEIIEARIGPPTKVASRAFSPACTGSAEPATNASTRNAKSHVQADFGAICSFPCHRPGRRSTC